MQIGFRGITVATILALSPGACGNRNTQPDLLNFPGAKSPDEFTVLPGKPLEAPEDYGFLPAPTPGGGNRTDPTPKADAVVALGGRGAAIARDGAPGADGGLIAHASRFGTAPDIRRTLAAEDLQFRRRNNGRLLERLFNVNIYFRSYERQSLDQYAELRRLRRLGVRTPAAPPDTEVRGEK